MKKPKTKVDIEISRIQNYIKRQMRKYGSNLIVDESLSTEALKRSAKRGKGSLKQLQSLTAKILAEQLQVKDPETGKVSSLADVQRHHRVESQRLARESATDFWSDGVITSTNKYVDTETGEIVYTTNPLSNENLAPADTAELPLKEDIELNNAAEALSYTLGQEWVYHSFNLANYKEFQRIINDQINYANDKKSAKYNITMHKQGAAVANWLQGMVDKVGLEQVAYGLNQFLGQNGIIREMIFYRGEINYEFAWRMSGFMGLSYDDRISLGVLLENYT